MTYGLTPTGFAKKPLDVIKAEVEADLLGGISPVLDLEAAGVLGNFIGTQADRAAELWDQLEALFDAFDPDQNGGLAQDAVCALTGTERDSAKFSKVVCTMNAQAGKTILAGSAAYVQGNPIARFALDADLLGNGSGTQTAGFTATAAGLVQALAGTLNTIATPVDGWISVTNPQDAQLGALVESDTALRKKREQELAASGNSTVDAIRADMLDTANPALQGGTVFQCNVFENVTEATDVNGLPSRAIEVLVYDGLAPTLTNNQIAQAVWNAKGGGIRTFGTASGTATDANGDAQTVFFSRPVQRPIYLAFDLTPGVGYAGDAAIQASLVEYGATFLSGQDVVVSALYPSVFIIGGSLSGVSRLAAIRAGFAASPAGTTDLVIGIRELAIFDSSRITINHV